MIYAYGVSLPGTYHIKHGIVCQDSHKIIGIGKDIAVAAVADGLGSAAHSDVGSKIAVTIATEICRKHIAEITANGKKQVTAEQVLNVIRASFHAAHRAIEKEANSKDRSQDLYDTTLVLAVMIRDTLYYGHSGDSGIIALTIEGSYEKVTEQQRDEEGRVFPLFFTDKWEFAQYEHKVSAVLLATDGMLETFFPMYIKNDSVNIHVSLAQFFMDYQSLRIVKLGQEAVQTKMKDFMEKIPDEQVNDDKTVVVLVNPAIKTKRQPKEYYQEPDWAELKQKHDEEWKRAAYPHLFKDTHAQNGREPSTKQAERNPSAPKQEDEPPEPVRSRRRPSSPRKPRKLKRLRILLLAVMVACLSVTATAITIVIRHVIENGDEQPVYEDSYYPEQDIVTQDTEPDELELYKDETSYDYDEIEQPIITDDADMSAYEPPSETQENSTDDELENNEQADEVISGDYLGDTNAYSDPEETGNDMQLNEVINNNTANEPEDNNGDDNGNANNGEAGGND